MADTFWSHLYQDEIKYYAEYNCRQQQRDEMHSHEGDRQKYISTVFVYL